MCNAEEALIAKTLNLTTPGKMRRKLSAAHSAFGFPPFVLSSKLKRVCRTGLENETVLLSTNVIVRTPHAWKRNQNI
jgi:hypothetical protein